MNLICKLLGHKWRDTSSRQYVDIIGKKVDCWVKQCHCDRCNIDSSMIVTPIEEKKR